MFLWPLFNPFAPEPPVQVHILSALCDVISFHGQGQLCLLTCASEEIFQTIPE